MRRIWRGVVAGAAGTLAMDVVWYRRSKQGGGTQSFLEWETADGLATWDRAPAPGQVAKRALELFGYPQPPDSWARPMTNAVHWATGIVWGVQYAVLVRHKRWYSGVAFAPVVWLLGYVLLAPLGVYKPIWKYDATTLVEDLTAHLAYGTATGAVFSVVEMLER